MSVLVVSDAHVFWPLSCFLVLSFVLSFVWLITGCLGFGVLVCVFVASSWLLVVCLVCVRVLSCCVRAPLVVGLVCGAGRVVCPRWVIGLLSLCVWCARESCVCLRGCVFCFLFVGSGCVWRVW